MSKEELLLEQWKIASELHRHEYNHAWNTFNYFLILNGILLSVFSAILSGSVNIANMRIDTKVVSIIISIFGLVTSLFWSLMQLRGKLYHRYRIEQAKDIERKLLIGDERVLTLYETGLDDQNLFPIRPLERKLMFLRALDLMLALSVLVFLAWLAALIYFLFVTTT